MSDLGSFEWMRDVMGEVEASEVYAELSRGGTPRGREMAGTASYAAREHWPDFFAVADRPALASCARMFDEYPWLTTSLVRRAVEALYGRSAITPGDVVEAAQLIDDF